MIIIFIFLKNKKNEEKENEEENPENLWFSTFW